MVFCLPMPQMAEHADALFSLKDHKVATSLFVFD